MYRPVVPSQRFVLTRLFHAQQLTVFKKTSCLTSGENTFGQQFILPMFGVNLSWTILAFFNIKSFFSSFFQPSTFVREKDCSLCQCLNNEYVCTPAFCGSTTKITTSTSTDVTDTMEFIVTPVLVPSLPECPVAK